MVLGEDHLLRDSVGLAFIVGEQPPWCAVRRMYYQV